MPRSGLTSSKPIKPTQFEPTPSDHAVNIIDSHGSVDINNRAAEWRESGWAGVGPEAPEDEVIVVETTYVIVPEERKRAS